eukprot:SAG11_NODE_9786_length_880_cov_12.861716_1_plen_68_part_10
MAARPPSARGMLESERARCGSGALLTHTEVRRQNRVEALKKERDAAVEEYARREIGRREADRRSRDAH